MMIAMWEGRCSKLIWRASASSGEPGGNHASNWSSDIETSCAEQIAILAVVHRDEPEAGWRRRDARRSPQATFQHTRNALCRPTFVADFDQGSCHRPDHVAEESVGS